ncbi:MAG: SLAP domain-containing protein, partial [Candidatus Limosilactobacillus intestinavium]
LLTGVDAGAVNAANSYKITLNHNAAVYNVNGKKKGAALKNGKILTAYGVKKIHGKKYYNLGSGKYIKVANATKVAAPKKNDVTTATTASTNKSGLMSLATKKYADQVASSFVTQLNEMRSKRGVKKLTVKPSLQSYAETRAKEVVNKFSHIRPNGKRTAYEENIGLNSIQVTTTPEEAAKAMLDQFIYHDAASNWAHKKSLLNKNNKTIGVGVAFEAKPGMATQGNKFPNYLGNRIVVNLQK